MPKKTECGQGPDRGEAAARLARWAGALSEAEMALAGGEPQEAERRAKAISAIVRAEADIAQWREQTLGPAQAEETELDGEAFRRALEQTDLVCGIGLPGDRQGRQCAEPVR